MSEHKEWVYKLPEKLQTASDAEDLECPLSGVVKLKLLLGSARMRKFKEIQYALNDKGELVSRSGADMAPDLIEFAEKSILEVDLKLKANGVEVKTMEDLSMSEEGVTVLTHLGHMLVNGPKLGKP